MQPSFAELQAQRQQAAGWYGDAFKVLELAFYAGIAYVVLRRFLRA